MFVPTKAKIEKVASKDQSRPVLTSVYLRVVEPATDTEPGRGYLEATDSYKLARVPVILDAGDVEGFLPPEALTAARKADRLRPTIAANGTADVKDGASYARPDLGIFPSVDQLIPENLHEFRIGLNARFLYELAQGIGSDTVSLQFCAHRETHRGATFAGDETIDDYSKPSNLRPITVRPMGGEPDSIGILMPIRLAG